MIKMFSKLTDERYEFIKGEVIHLFELLNIKCVPVSGFEIASKMKITLIPYSSLSANKLKVVSKVSKDGFYMEVGSKEYIFYNDIEISYKRQNMTILHEIGHCVLDHTGHSQQEEIEANFFAKYAIAPPVLVHKIKAKTPKDIYRNFDISEEASQYAFNYYLRWKRRYDSTGILTNYEIKLLSLYQTHA